jgi:protein TonB
LAGTAIICIVAAFGAAFLVARAVNHAPPARAATPPAKTTRVAATVTTPQKLNLELQSQFSPIKGSKLKPRPKPKPKHKKAKPKPQVSFAPASPTTSPATPTPTPTYTAPSYTPPPPSAPTQSSSGSTTTHHKKSSGGSGTTTIG